MCGCEFEPPEKADVDECEGGMVFLDWMARIASGVDWPCISAYARGEASLPPLTTPYLVFMHAGVPDLHTQLRLRPRLHYCKAWIIFDILCIKAALKLHSLLFVHSSRAAPKRARHECTYLGSISETLAARRGISCAILSPRDQDLGRGEGFILSQSRFPLIIPVEAKRMMCAATLG